MKDRIQYEEGAFCIADKAIYKGDARGGERILFIKAVNVIIIRSG